MKRIALGLLSFFLPAWAFAASSSSALSLAPPAGDYSVIFLGNIFGIVDGVLHGSGSQIMGNMFAVFNAAVLALGGIIIMYTLLVSTMNTAQEGQMLGQKWSSIWVPLRATLGLALLIPKTSGYCLMQIFVMWVIVQGIGAADKVWAAALSYLNRGGVIIAAQIAPSTSLSSGNGSVATGAAVILQGQVCMASVQAALQNALQSYLAAKNSSAGSSGPCMQTTSGVVTAMSQFCNSNSVPDFINTVNVTTVQTANPTSTTPYKVPMPNFGTGSIYASLNGVCGTIVWNPFSASSVQSIQNNISNVTSSEIQTVQQSRSIAIQQMYMDLATVARAMVQNNPSLNPPSSSPGSAAQNNFSTVAVQQYGVPFLSSGTPCSGIDAQCTTWGPVPNNSSSPLFNGTEFQGAITDYNGIMMPTLNLVQQAQSNTNANNLRNFIQQANSQGWMMAGGYFFNLSQLNAASINSSNLTDTNTGLDSSTIDTSNLSASFVGGTGCSTTAPFNNLCTWLSGNQGTVSTIITAINGSTAGNNPIPANVSPTAHQAVGSLGSSTATGYINNSVMVNLPGQPGMAPPSFAMKFNFDINLGQYKLQPQSFPCGEFGIWPIKFCLGAILGGIFYNLIILNVFNLFLSILAPFINVIIQSFLAAPLLAIAQIFQQSVAIIQQPAVNPVIALANMGVNYINYANEVWILLIGLSATPLITIVLPLILLIMPLLLAWLGVMVAIGFITAYYIPFLPYMIFTFGSIAWLMAVIEAMVAAPIVALGVTHPEGHDAFGKGEQALMILMNVFLRPSMMIIGFIGAISLSYVSVWVINAGFSNAMSFVQGTVTGTQWNYSYTQSQNVFSNTSQNPTSSQIAMAQANNFSSMNTGYSGWAGIYGFFFSVVVYTTMYVTVVQKSYTLITYLPDKVLRWIGGQAESLGEQSNQWAEESKKQVETGGEQTQNKSQARDSAMGGKVMEGAAGLKKKLGGGGGSSVGGGG
ncbi:Phagosome trafficking protein DotA [Legionella massiliensis]|uniref:Phagosome trafficking protein DotA n=2 Tax=Legionella massiliensis TaxID=1034943 RepID=A0A078KU97_9GAMM|nr:Phagosome trafficking protein DotA [Legionella massiliensis]CEE12300.1 Phagosome trafficking protein DotA [Legionella massiliensis]